jgi:hypothetical protein
MLRSRLQSQLQLLALPQLLSGARGNSSSLSLPAATAAAAAATGVPADAQHAAQLQPVRWFAAESAPESQQQPNSEVARAAHQLGLDAVPLEQLKCECWHVAVETRGFGLWAIIGMAGPVIEGGLNLSKSIIIM